jgi:hypothetical protein
MLTRLWLWLLTRLGFDPRGLFVFFDGHSWRTVDPLQIARALMTHPTFDWDETPQLLTSGQSVVQLDAFGRIALAVREVFEIQPVERGGLSERECLELLTDFRTYLGDVKKNGSLFPISPASTARRSSDEMPVPAKPDSDCGSTPTEPLPVPPGSPVEPTSAV